jgi:hypothetical protein
MKNYICVRSVHAKVNRIKVATTVAENQAPMAVVKLKLNYKVERHYCYTNNDEFK